MQLVLIHSLQQQQNKPDSALLFPVKLAYAIKIAWVMRREQTSLHLKNRIPFDENN